MARDICVPWSTVPTQAHPGLIICFPQHGLKQLDLTALDSRRKLIRCYGRSVFPAYCHGSPVNMPDGWSPSNFPTDTNASMHHIYFTQPHLERLTLTTTRVDLTTKLQQSLMDKGPVQFCPPSRSAQSLASSNCLIISYVWLIGSVWLISSVWLFIRSGVP